MNEHKCLKQEHTRDLNISNLQQQHEIIKILNNKDNRSSEGSSSNKFFIEKSQQNSSQKHLSQKISTMFKCALTASFDDVIFLKNRRVIKS